MRITMKPETLARRARERAERKTARRVEHLRRLRIKAERDPNGIWAELLRDAESRPR